MKKRNTLEKKRPSEGCNYKIDSGLNEMTLYCRGKLFNGSLE